MSAKSWRVAWMQAAAGGVSCMAIFGGVASARPCELAPVEELEVRGDELPDTAAGRVARAFLAMANDATAASVERFEKEFASTTRREAVEPAERARRLGEMKREFGAVKFEKVIGSSDTGITLGVHGANVGSMEWEFQLSAKEPGKLDGVMIARGGPIVKAEPVSPAQVTEITEAAIGVLEKSYVFPEIATRMGESVRAKLKAGQYAGIKDERELAAKLTEDFRAVSKDKHLRVNFAPQQSEQQVIMGRTDDMARRENYGFRKVELLPGNIGYIRFDIFDESDAAKQAATAALTFVQNADAVIFDLRYNGGGSPEMIRYMQTYLFDTRTHLNSMIDREGKVVEEFWTLDDVPGKRLGAAMPVYVLTSSRTFSGAEEFSYNLKNLKRGTIIGEVTGGGAHPVRGERLNDRFMIGVPYMRANNPISKTNWEGTGVQPDIKVPAAEALERALEEARK